MAQGEVSSFIYKNESPTNQSTNQSVNQLVNQPIRQPTK